ncbi:hypothetical protein JB92DRAFT_2832963 [Gautieria morchelliformis]|nr:hypothetical protein JB92DRAFT_2832963 [Gautieria morchelliformis]
MARFPDVTSLDYITRFDGDRIVQGPVLAPSFPFQHSSEFDFYRPGKFDFIFLDHPEEVYAVLRHDLASCFWESLKMKGRYILAAANDWNGETAENPLPLTIPDEKLAEIGMPHPPFPLIHQLTYNFLLLPESPDVIRGRLATWQDNSRQLAAWIRKAKLKTAVLAKSLWKWPTPPTPTCFNDSDGQSRTDDTWPSNSSEHDTVLGESPEPALNLTSSARVARSFNAEVQVRDGSEPNKKQLVLWQPSIAQLLERQLMLLRGEILTYPTALALLSVTLVSLPPKTCRADSKCLKGG